MSGAHEATETCPGCWLPTPLSILGETGQCPSCDLRAARIRWAAAERLPVRSREHREAREELRRREWPSPTD